MKPAIDLIKAPLPPFGFEAENDVLHCYKGKGAN